MSGVSSATATAGAGLRLGGRSDEAAALGAWPATAAVTALAAALYLAFVGYGYELSDEGTILYQILRTHRGELPYLDFETGYTPAVFFLNAWLFDLFGVSAVPIRLLLAAVNAGSVLLVFRLALRFAPPLESALAALGYGLFLPFFAGQFASFNIPYPAWYAATAWLGCELAVVRAVETGRRSWLLAAGALAGVAFSFKPNTGVLALGAVVLARLLCAAPLEGRLGAWLESSVLAAAFGGVVAVLGLDLATEQFALLGLPLLVLIVAAGARRSAWRRLPGASRRPADGFRDVGAILGGFVATSGAWLGFFLPRLGLGRFGHDVLLLGAGVERIYLLYYPDLSAWSAALLLGIAAAWALPWALARGWVGMRGLGALAAAAVVAGLAAIARFGLAPEGIRPSVVMQLENLSFFAIPALLGAGVAVWIARTGRPAEALAGREGLATSLGVGTVGLVFALMLFLQLFPRIDFMHVVIAMPSALVLAAGALRRLELRWQRALGEVAAGGWAATRRGRAAIRAFAVAPVALALGARAFPFLEARLAPGGWGLRATTSLGRSALPVVVERDRDRDLSELRAVADLVERSTAPEDPIVVFPALAMIPFLTGRHTPVAHDYFFPGRPGHAEEAVMVEQIERARPPLVVTLNDRLGYFSAAPAYYFILRDYVQTHYALSRHIGRFDVLVRRDSAAARRPASTVGQGFSPAFAHGRYRALLEEARRLGERGRLEDLGPGWAWRLADVDRSVREATARGLLALAARAPGGLAAVERRVARNARARLLFVRALGEYAGRDALAYLAALYERSDGRLRWETGRSINYILARDLAARFDLVAPPRERPWALPPGLDADALVAEIGDFVERQRIGPLAALAAAEARRSDLAPALEHFRDEDETTWWRLVASYALSRLGRRGRVRTILETIRWGTLGAQYAPSLLLDPTAVEPRLAAEAVASLLAHGTAEERETAAWMVPFLAARGARAALEAVARRDPEPAVRRAAAWAIARLHSRAAARKGSAESRGGAA